MNSDLFFYLMNNTGSLSMQEILINFFASIAVGFVIFLSYRFSHAGAVYSGKFNASLWMLTMVTTMVMCVIGNNIALSLGMVGALSIVRFRTAIKDARDSVYIFWCIAAGICCGISDFIIAAMGSTVIFILMLFIGGIRENNRYLLIIRTEDRSAEMVENAVKSSYKGKARLCVKNSGHGNVEYIYELSRKVMEMDKNINRLLKENGIQEVNLVSQSSEITS